MLPRTVPRPGVQDEAEVRRRAGVRVCRCLCYSCVHACRGMYGCFMCELTRMRVHVYLCIHRCVHVYILVYVYIDMDVKTPLIMS